MFKKFLSVRALSAIAIVGTFCYLAVTRFFSPEQVMIITNGVIIFYFTKKRKKEIDK